MALLGVPEKYTATVAGELPDMTATRPLKLNRGIDAAAADALPKVPSNVPAATDVPL